MPSSSSTPALGVGDSVSHQPSHPANPPAPANPGVKVEVGVLQVQPRPAQLIPIDVARIYHEQLVERFADVQGEYEDTWRLEKSPFPYLCFHVVGPGGEPLLGLLADARNYPHRALSVTLTDPSFTGTVGGVPSKPADTERERLVYNQDKRRHWFCTPGTDEYHTHYSGVEPFDRIRGAEEIQPLEVVLRCIRHIDHKGLHNALKEQASR